jgi:hypothetical protein
MMCVFDPSASCIQLDNSKEHGACRGCWMVPIMDYDTEKRVLMGVAGERRKKKINPSEKPEWLKELQEKHGGWDFIPCTDHRRCDGENVVNEPYSVSMAQLKELISFCEEENLYFYIDGNSTHFPGYCIRIVVSKR